MQQFVNSLCLCYQMYVKNTCTSTELCQCHIAVQIRCGWCVWWRHLDNIHQSSCKICKSMFPSMVMSCVSYRNMRCLTIQTVIPYTIQPQTPVKASFLNAMVTLSKWSRSGFRTPRSPSFKWVGHQSALAATHGHLSNGPGLASGIGRCRIQDEDTITIWQRSGNPPFFSRGGISVKKSHMFGVNWNSR